MIYTPENITRLEPEQVFVFGSNADGIHAGGAARVAYEKFGAVWGEGHGHHGQSYAIDTMSGFDVLAAGVYVFIDYAHSHPGLTFLVTPIGCGIAGYTHAEIAPLFEGAPANVILPEVFA
ncbi:hypothetical protein [Microbacterium sp.]|uniref:A1S_2505 family phage non-structural protein n=1 Tax=Microbacterium sp. TaxID=51671 RepID=UPI0039E67E50